MKDRSELNGLAWHRGQERRLRCRLVRPIQGPTEVRAAGTEGVGWGLAGSEGPSVPPPLSPEGTEPLPEIPRVSPCPGIQPEAHCSGPPWDLKAVTVYFGALASYSWNPGPSLFCVLSLAGGLGGTGRQHTGLTWEPAAYLAKAARGPRGMLGMGAWSQ